MKKPENCWKNYLLENIVGNKISGKKFLNIICWQKVLKEKDFRIKVLKTNFLRTFYKISEKKVLKHKFLEKILLEKCCKKMFEKENWKKIWQENVCKNKFWTKKCLKK